MRGREPRARRPRLAPRARAVNGARSSRARTARRLVCATLGAATDLHAPMGAAEPVVALDHVEPGQATGARSFQVLHGPHNGSTRATMFVGYIPPGKAPWHYHLYDEIVWVLRGEGRLHIGDTVEPLDPERAFRLRPREVHIVENTDPAVELAVLGIFTPAGKPVRRVPDSGRRRELRDRLTRPSVVRRTATHRRSTEPWRHARRPTLGDGESRHPRRRRRPGRPGGDRAASFSTGTPGTTTSSASDRPTEARRSARASSRRTGESRRTRARGSGARRTTGGELLGEVRQPPPARQARAARRLGRLGLSRGRATRSSRRSSTGKIDHYVVRPVGAAGRALPPGDLDVPARVGRGAAHRAVRDPRGRRLLVGAGRTSCGTVLERCAFPHAFCLADSEEGRKLLGRTGAWRRVAAWWSSRTARRSANPSDAELTRATGSAVEPEERSRPPDRRRRARRAVGGRLRRLRGAQHARRRPARDRRAGTVELADPQLPRVPARRQRRACSPARRTSRRGSSAPASRSCSDVTALRATTRRPARRDPLRGRRPSRRVRSSSRPASRYRRLGIPALEELAGAGVFYGGAGSDAQRMAGQEVYVLGGANSAGQAALHLARYARRLTLVVRAPSLEAGMSHYLVRQLEATPNVEVRLGTEVVGGGGDGWLDAPRPARPGERSRGDGRRRRALPLDRRTPAHGVAARRDRARRRGLRPDGRGRPAGRRLAARARPAPARDEHAGRPRRRRRPARIGQARRVRRRRGLDRDPGRSIACSTRTHERAGRRAERAVPELTAAPSRAGRR